MLTDEDKKFFMGLDLQGEADMTGNLAQPTTPEKRAKAIKAGREAGVPFDVAERNLDTLTAEDKAWFKGLKINPPEETTNLLHDPEMGPAAANDIEELGYMERFLLDGIQHFQKGRAVTEMGEIGTAVMMGTATPQQLERLGEVQAYLDSDFMRTDYSIDNPVFGTAQFIHGAVYEQIPIMGYMMWEAKEEMAKGATLGTVVGASIGGVGAAPGALVGAGVGFKIGSAQAAYTLEAGNAYLEYIAMRDENTGQLMDPEIARAAAATVGLTNAALEFVAFQRLMRTVPGMDKLMNSFTRQGMKKTMRNPTARAALKRWGKNILGVSATEGMTEMAQETLTILGKVAAAELDPGEYDLGTLEDAMKQIGHAGLAGAAGGGGISVPTAGAQAYLEMRQERAAFTNRERMNELEQMAKDVELAENLPEDFKSFLLRARATHGEAAETSVELNTLRQFFQNAGIDAEQIQERMPAIWDSMQEAEAAGTDVVLPFEELAGELAREETFNALVDDLKVGYEGMTAKDADALVAEREAVMEEFRELANREDITEGATDRVHEDVRLMLEGTGMPAEVVQPQAELHARWWTRLGERMGQDPYKLYKAYGGLSIGRIAAGVLEGKGFERSDAIIARLRAGEYPTPQQMFGASMSEWIRANGGLVDEGGELSARDADSLIRNGQRAMSLEEAHQRLIEAGYLPEASWTDKTQGDLLELIDRELAGDAVYRIGGGDTQMQDVWREMSELEELLDQMQLDISEMTNDEVRAAILEGSYFQGAKWDFLDQGDYDALSAEERTAVDQALEENPDPERIRAALRLHKDTPWARQAIAGAKARIAIRHIIAGEEIPFPSAFDHPRTARTRKQLEKGGMEAVEQILNARSVIGSAGKPLNAVNSSFLNCEPSANCAKYCYATGNNYRWAANIIKGELITMFVEHNPVRAAELAARDYKPMAEDGRDKALRLFDKGDGDERWLPFIHELNKRGVRVQIFSKRPEFLRQVPDGNWAMLSIDQSNLEMADENPDLDIAMVYEGTDEEIHWMNERKERIAVILIIEGRGTRQARAEAVAKIPKDLRKKKCPLTAGVKNIENKNVKWNCQRCDKGGGVGCYNAKTMDTMPSIDVSFPEAVDRAVKTGVMAELEEFRDGLTGRERTLLDQELAAIVSEARTRFDREATRDPENERSGADARTEESAGVLRATGTRTLKQLYQMSWHGTAPDFDLFSVEFMGAGEGHQAFGWGLYFTDLETTAEHYRQVALDKARERALEDHLGKHWTQLEFLSLETTGVQVPGFLVAEKIANAIRLADTSTRAAVVAELRAQMETIAETEAMDPMVQQGLRGPEWSEVPAYQAAIEGLERQVVGSETMDAILETWEQPGQVYRVELMPKDDEWLMLDMPIADQMQNLERLLAYTRELQATHEIADDILELLEQVKRERNKTHVFSEKYGEEHRWTGATLYRRLSGVIGADREASEYLLAAGVRGNKFFDYGTRNREGRPEEKVLDPESTFNYVVFDAADAVIHDRLYQENMGSPKGFITFDETRAWFKITLTEKADLSTFLHESGHFFLEMMRRVGQSPDAPTDLKADLAILEEHFGVPPGEPWPTEAHERFARSFEQYLMNGEAPSLQLVEAFTKFKAWLTAIYKRLTALNVDMTPEVRGVFDRMLASQEAINEARTAMDFRPVFESAEDAGMSPEQFHAYHRLMDQAHRGAQEELDLKLLREMKRAQTEEYRRLKAQVREDVEREVAQDPVQRAKHLLRTGKLLTGEPTPEELEGLKLSSQALMSMYPHRKILQRLVGMHRKGGRHPDLVADQLGFESGDQMIQAILKAPPRKKLIDQLTERRMMALHGDMMNDGTLEAAAIQAMHTDAVSRFLLAELKALARQAKAPEGRPLDVIKQAAQQRVANMKIQNLTPGRYRQAEAREGRKAIELAAKGDFVGAHEAKRKQLLNHWMSRYITEARDRAAKQRDYLKKFDRKDVRQRMGRAGRETYLDAIDVYLDGIELRKTPLKRIAMRQSLQDWIAARQAADEAVQIPERLHYEASLKNFKELTVTEFEAIHDAVKNIEHLANLKNKLLSAKERRDFNEAKNTLIAQIYETQKRRPAETEQNRRFWSRQWHRILQFHAELLKPEFLARWIDGEATGPAHRLIFQPFVDAQIEKLDMEQEIGRKVEALFKTMTKEQRARLHQKFDIFGRNSTGQEVLAIALNLGNEGNAKKLLLGEPNRGWTYDTLMARLDEIMTIEDWHLVQGIWDLLEELKPAIFELNERMTGLPPPEVQARSFTVQGVTFRGGYYPVVYDRHQKAKHDKNAQKKEAPSIFENNFLRPNVSKGFTEERTEYVGPLQLSLDVLPAHISEVIHFVTHYEAVTQVNKLLEHEDVKAALWDTFGEEVQRQFRPWLQSIASASVVPERQSVWNTIFKELRHGTSVMAMGFKFSTAMMQAFGMFTTLDQIGAKYTLEGMMEAAAQLGAGKRVFEDINQKSGEVRHAMRTFDRDARSVFDETFRRVGPMKTWSKLQGYTFALMGTVQKFVNMATWYGAYSQALKEKNMSEERATQYADAAVRQAQSAGGIKDLAAIQRGGDGLQIMVMFYTYFSVYHNRLVEVGRQARGKQRVKDTPHVAARLTFLMFLPVFFEAVVRREWPDEDEEPVEFWSKRLLLYGVIGIPFVRDLAGGMFSDFGYQMSPVGQILKRIAYGGKGAYDMFFHDEEMTETEMRGLFDAVGVAAKLPGGQLWIMYNWLKRATEGELEAPFHELIYKARE